MKISKGQVFNLYDDFANVNQTFLAHKEFDISDLLANGVYQYNFAHKFYTHENYINITDEQIVLDWFADKYKDLVTKIEPNDQALKIRFLIARDISIPGDENNAADYVAINEDGRFIITYPNEVSFFKAIPTAFLQDHEEPIDLLSKNSLVFESSKDAIKNWQKENNDQKTRLSIIEINTNKIVLNYDNEYQNALSYYRTPIDIKAEEFKIHNLTMKTPGLQR